MLSYRKYSKIRQLYTIYTDLIPKPCRLAGFTHSPCLSRSKVAGGGKTGQEGTEQEGTEQGNGAGERSRRGGVKNGSGILRNGCPNG